MNGAAMKHNDPINVEVPNTQELQRLHVEAKKRISDLPVPVGKMNLISLVLSYTMFGVRDEEIGHALGLEPTQITRIKETSSYVDIQKEITDNILKADSQTIRGMFVQGSTRAVGRLTELVESDDENVALSALKDVLDRAGHRPADVHEHRHSVQGGLVIEYVDRKSDEQSLPSITVHTDGEF
jgi:hypothetical protein